MHDPWTQEIGGALIVKPDVRCLDAEAAAKLREIVGPLARERSLVVISLGDVEAIDCSGLAGLVWILKHMPPGGELRLASPSAPVRALLAATHLDELFHVFDDSTAAMLA
jgi:anti-anti-sigma factor